MPESPPEQYVVLGLDIIQYSRKNLLQQKMAQEKFSHCFNASLKETNPKLFSDPPHWIDAGDGGYALFRHADLHVLEFLKEFYRRLNRENQDIGNENAKLFVRAAMHKEDVIVWDNEMAGKEVRRFTGHAINNCARLMSGMIKDHAAQVVSSRPVLDSIMQIDRNVAPTRLKDIIDKHGNKHEVWNLRIDPILGVNPIAKELHADPLSRVYHGPHA